MNCKFWHSKYNSLKSYLKRAAQRINLVNKENMDKRDCLLVSRGTRKLVKADGIRLQTCNKHQE